MTVMPQLSVNTGRQELATIVATPYPAAPDFPLCRGQNRPLYTFLFIHNGARQGATTTLSGKAAVQLKNPQALRACQS